MTAFHPALDVMPLRLHPGDDLRGRLEAVAREQGAACFVLSGIGSLGITCLRLAGADRILRLEDDQEILTLAGSLSADGAHLHMSVADAEGRVRGGHVMAGCLVRTTAELLLARLPSWALGRELDAATGYAELVIRRSGQG